MSERLTTTQVIERKERFEAFMNSVNLVRLGRRYYHMVANDAKDGRYTSYCYLLHVLAQLAHVEGTGLHPDTCKEGHHNRCYREILHDAAITAMTDWFNKYWEAVREITTDMEACINSDMTIYQGSKGYTPKQIIWNINNLTAFGQQYVEDYYSRLPESKK
jgi:hypothetical protein